ncbi:hypothetical protein P5V15_006189 [Pogonomyrmex californicus]
MRSRYFLKVREETLPSYKRMNDECSCAATRGQEDDLTQNRSRVTQTFHERGERKKRVFKKCLDKPCSVVPNGSAKSSSSATSLVNTVIAPNTWPISKKDLCDINKESR